MDEPKKKPEVPDSARIDLITQAVNDPGIPKIYFNGFATGAGNSDVVIVLQSNSKPTLLLNASFTTIKTLSKKLDELIVKIEKNSGSSIMVTEELETAFKKITNAQD